MSLLGHRIDGQLLYDPFKTNSVLEMSFNMEIFDSGSSQNSDLSQEQLNNMEKNAKADNTKRATKWGLIKAGANQETWFRKQNCVQDAKKRFWKFSNAFFALRTQILCVQHMLRGGRKRGITWETLKKRSF